jgi:hypothetical protein
MAGPAAWGLTRRWSGPRRRYTLLAVERRACAAAAAQRPYVMRQEQLDYEPRERTKPAVRPLDLLAVVGLLLGLAWFAVLSYADHNGAQYSNRIFARPAMSVSRVVCLWGALRLTSVPVVVRVLCFPVAFVIGYAGIGLCMILFNAHIGG